MRRTKAIFAAILVAALIPLPSMASSEDYFSAAQVESKCQEVELGQIGPNDEFSFKSSYPASECWGAFWAMGQMLIMDEYESSSGICLPNKATVSQLVLIFSKYVRDHPEISHRSFASVAMEVLSSRLALRRPQLRVSITTPHRQAALTLRSALAETKRARSVDELVTHV